MFEKFLPVIWRRTANQLHFVQGIATPSSGHPSTAVRCGVGRNSSSVVGSFVQYLGLLFEVLLLIFTQTLNHNITVDVYIRKRLHSNSMADPRELDSSPDLP